MKFPKLPVEYIGQMKLKHPFERLLAMKTLQLESRILFYQAEGLYGTVGLGLAV